MSTRLRARKEINSTIEEQRMDAINLRTQAGILTRISPTSLIIFLDETGEEKLKDPKYPIFGIGGCVVHCQMYRPQIIEKWKKLKLAYFEGAEKALHAADLNSPTLRQLEALNYFFSNSLFARIATVLSDRTIFDSKYDVTDIVVASLYKRIASVISYYTFSEIVLILEDSEIADKILAYSEGYIINKSGFKIKINKFIMPKKSNEPGLEVADFIIHCAGTAVRDRIKGKRTKEKERKDFSAVFENIDPAFSSYLEISEISNIEKEASSLLVNKSIDN